MAEGTEPSVSNVVLCSSLDADVWRGLGGGRSFESWHFDAVSDDGREALIISFYDNYPMSPRFYEAAAADDAENGNTRSSQRCPAVSLVYSSGGRTIFDAACEYGANEFHINDYKLDYSIGESRFRTAEAAYGAGMFVTVDVRTRRQRRIRADIEWLFVESDLMPQADGEAPAIWNFAAPRADVTGKISLIGRRGKVRRSVNFRGTGYHDHISSRNSHFRDLRSRMWGRAHFVDSTVIFERHGGVQDRTATGMLIVIRDGQIVARPAECTASAYALDRWGLNIPRDVEYRTKDGLLLKFEPTVPLRSGPAEVKTLGRVQFETPDGKKRETTGLAEFIAPHRMDKWMFRQLADLRIGTNGRGPWI